MTQVITKVAIGAFINALNVHRRTSELVRYNTCPSDQIMLKVAQAFNEDFQPGASLEANRARIEKFYSERCHVRLCFDGAQSVGGYVVLDGELLAFHNLQRGKGDWMMLNAVADGATRLDCFAELVLVNLYQRHGFKMVRAVPNRDPDGVTVIYMERIFQLAIT